MYQSCRHVLYCELLHWHHPKRCNQVSARDIQTLEQRSNGVVVLYGCLQACEMVPKHLDLTNTVQKAITFLHFANEELATNENDVQQALGLVDVAKLLSHLCCFFTTFDIHKLVVRQVEADNEYGIFYMFLILLQHFRIRRWSFLKVVNTPKVH